MHILGGCVYKFVGMYTRPRAHPYAPLYTQLEVGERWEGGNAGTEEYSPLSLVGSTAPVSFYLESQF